MGTQDIFHKNLLLFKNVLLSTIFFITTNTIKKYHLMQIVCCDWIKLNWAQACYILLVNSLLPYLSFFLSFFFFTKTGFCIHGNGCFMDILLQDTFIISILYKYDYIKLAFIVQRRWALCGNWHFISFIYYYKGMLQIISFRR